MKNKQKGTDPPKLSADQARSAFALRLIHNERTEVDPRAQPPGMLVLTRKEDEVLIIETGGEVITIIVDQVGGSRVRMVIDAPRSIRIQDNRVGPEIVGRQSIGAPADGRNSA